MAQPYIGEIRVFAGNFAPLGWALCNGQLMAIAENTALFQLLGTTYGGDGVQTFALPNLQGRVLIHQGQAIGLSNYLMGQVGGAESVALSAQQLPVHTHPLVGVAASATAPNPGPNVTLAMSPSGIPIYGTGANTALAPQAITAAGSGQAHENRQPYLAITNIIALNGIFPSQD
jgi:microcystin-dependent protein